MDDFLDRYFLQTLNHDQINGLNGPMCPKEIEAFKPFPTKKKKKTKSQDYMVF